MLKYENLCRISRHRLKTKKVPQSLEIQGFTALFIWQGQKDLNPRRTVLETETEVAENPYKSRVIRFLKFKRWGKGGVKSILQNLKIDYIN